MKKPLLLLAISLATLQSFAQKDKSGPTFGVITPAELEMKSTPIDTTASAVVLFDIGSVVLNEDFNATYKRHTRIKFFTAEDLDEFASLVITYETATESISKLKASTYNIEDGKIVESKLGDDGIFKQKVDKIYSQTKFTLPNVKPGSIIEYSYSWSMVGLLPSWKFQKTIPTIYSEYETSIPRTFTFRKDMQGFLPLTDVQSKNEGAYEKLVMKDIPAFRVEPYLTTPSDFVSGVNYYITEVFVPGKFFKLDNTWTDISKGHEKSPDFGGLTRATGWLDKTVDPIIAGVTSPEEKARKIYDYIKSNIVWTEQVDRIPDHSLKKVLEDKKGSSSEINMLMVAMMKRAELDAYPVLLSTRDHGIIRMFTPYSQQFNDVVCAIEIGAKYRLLDGTEKGLSFNALPERCLNGQGLLVKEGTNQWLPLVSGKARTIYTATLKVKNDGELSGTLAIARDGLDGGEMRSDFTALGKEKYVSQAFEGKGWEISKSEFVNIEQAAEVAKELHELTIRDHVQANGDIMYINPYIAGIEKNNFKSEKREYPVDIPSPFDHFYTAKIELPEGYKVEELPATKIYALPDNGGKFIYSATQMGNVVNFTSQLTITKNLIAPDNYPLLREFYSLVVAKQAEQIVLKKGN
jgi:Domain of Unknown Function with PDB structure (DUF3857)/Transglutaminase-like superfamily